jgi:hypothetical protein
MITSGVLIDTLATIGIVMLVGLLFQKELVSAAGGRFQNLVKTLNIAIVPLLIAFVLIVASKVILVIH